MKSDSVKIIHYYSLSFIRVLILGRILRSEGLPSSASGGVERHGRRLGPPALLPFAPADAP